MGGRAGVSRLDLSTSCRPLAALMFMARATKRFACSASCQGESKYYLEAGCRSVLVDVVRIGMRAQPTAMQKKSLEGQEANGKHLVEELEGAHRGLLCVFN